MGRKESNQNMWMESVCWEAEYDMEEPYKDQHQWKLSAIDLQGTPEDQV